MHKFLFIFVMSLCAAFGAQAAPRVFFSGYIGTVPPNAEDQAKTYFDRPEVRKLLTALENGGVLETAAANMLAGTNTQLADLERLHLVRNDKGTVRLGFPYFTASDIQLIHQVADKYLPTLIAAYKTRAADLDTILARYPVASVDRKRLAFVLLDGLQPQLGCARSPDGEEIPPADARAGTGLAIRILGFGSAPRHFLQRLLLGQQQFSGRRLQS